jgi:hypothetical protein
MTDRIVGIVTYKKKKHHKDEHGNDQRMELYFQRYNPHIPQYKPYNKEQRYQYNGKRV